MSEEASVEASEQDEEINIADKAVENQDITLEKEEATSNTTAACQAIIREPEDEIENISLGNESKKVKVMPNDICGTLSVIPIRHLNASNEYLIKSIAGKIETKKVKVCDVMVQRSAQGAFTRCNVVIEPCSGKDLEKIDFEFENCHVVPFYGPQVM